MRRQWHSEGVSHSTPTAERVALIPVSQQAQVYAEGWQSWTPTDLYPIAGPQHRPVDQRQFELGYRADRQAPSGRPGQFVADGLLALWEPDDQRMHLFSAVDPTRPVRLAATYRDGVCEVMADDDVDHTKLMVATVDDSGVQPWQSALRGWAAARGWATPPGPAPTVWCSWYQYFTDLTQADVIENVMAMDELELGFEVVQIDDGYQREIGDWLEPSSEFPDLAGLVAQIRQRGRRAGIWVAPWLVGERSRLAAEHPDWLVRDDNATTVSAGFNWDQRLWVLDTTNERARDYIHAALQRFIDLGVDYLKLDFLYAGALPGLRADGSDAIAAYRGLLADIRRWFPKVYVVACGAPVMPSVGLVDAMRVSPDTAPHVLPSRGDFSAPGQASAMLTGRARRWQHDAWWTNDPDCLLARPGVQSRHEWAAYLAEFPGLRGCSDRLRALDSEGLSYTLRHLQCATIQP